MAIFGAKRLNSALGFRSQPQSTRPALPMAQDGMGLQQEQVMIERASNPYEQDLDKNPANYVPLSPLSFIRRAAAVYPKRIATIHGDRRISWAETYERCRRLASALAKRGVGLGTTVSVMAPNIPPLYEAHFGVAMTGGVLNALNTRLDPDAIAFMLQHAETKVLIGDREYSEVIGRALAKLPKRPLVIDIDDPQYTGGKLLGELAYEDFLAQGDPDFSWELPSDEWNAISLNYTSGTTGNPKGVVYHHRGAYLTAIGNIVSWGMPPHPVYLWTLPMFHCNGWCFPWTVAAAAGTNVCLRRVEPKPIFDAIRAHRATHYCGAPIVHNMLVNAPAELRAGIKHTVYGAVGGAAPPAAMIEGMEKMGFNLTHVYGLTETYGPAAVCAKHPEWQKLSLEERADMNGRQGVAIPTEEDMMVADPETLDPVPRDGKTMGEIMFRGNLVMKGYLKNPKATQEALRGGWFHSGDLAVAQTDGYAKIKDRSKDIIISGGENISSIEVEDALYRHPAVLAAAVVAKPDEKWGETPCAFIELKEGMQPTEKEIIDFVRERIAHYKAPRYVVFGPLPKTSTGKIQKFVLREKAKEVR
jgi:3-(methylthio)propionyl---CoA ligase